MTSAPGPETQFFRGLRRDESAGSGQGDFGLRASRRDWGAQRRRRRDLTSWDPLPPFPTTKRPPQGKKARLLVRGDSPFWAPNGGGELSFPTATQKGGLGARPRKRKKGATCQKNRARTPKNAKGAGGRGDPGEGKTPKRNWENLYELGLKSFLNGGIKWEKQTRGEINQNEAPLDQTPTICVD